jgi:very-short-patch-repair endonuclease/protein-arginine kinase activator protein McsA
MDKIKGQQLSFFQRAANKHNNKFDYSLSEYVKMDVAIRIICPNHGEFTQKPVDHLHSNGCIKCTREQLRNSQISTREYIIRRFQDVHGDDYDYSLVTSAANHELVKIICPIHGLFEQSPTNHYKKKGCVKCGIKKCQNSNTYSQEEIIKEFNAIHKGRYNYSLVVYDGCDKHVKIICEIHGIFEQTPQKHKNKQGCKQCGYAESRKNRTVLYKGTKFKIDTDFIVKRFRDIHGDKYDYSLVKYETAKDYVEIICRIHGVFKQTPDAHKRKSGCPTCDESKGENSISEILSSQNIIFEREKHFETCVNIRKLPFDFYLPEYDAIIEYDGKQHYVAIEFFGGEKQLNYVQNNDRIKTEWADANGKKLLRVRYDDDVETTVRNFIDRLCASKFLDALLSQF